MRSLLTVLLAGAALLLLGTPAAADDGGPTFHRTTPRAALDVSDGVVAIGVPAGRAWGIESELRRLPRDGGVLVVRLTVEDDAVREAFVRLAYYASASTRTRQLAITDSAPVEAGEHRVVAVPLDPPPGAVAYRIRVLVRLAAARDRSSDDAVRVRSGLVDGGSVGMRPLLSRLLP